MFFGGGFPGGGYGEFPGGMPGRGGRQAAADTTGLYSALGVEKNASADDIKKAYYSNNSTYFEQYFLYAS